VPNNSSTSQATGQEPITETSARIAGTVVDETGKPLEGARVRVFQVVPPQAEYVSGQPYREVPMGEAAASPDGKFSIDVPSGHAAKGDWIVLAQKEGRSIDFLKWTGPAKGPQTLMLRLGEPKSVKGTIVDEQGKPVAGARLETILIVYEAGMSLPVNEKTLIGSSFLGVLMATTDKQGRFEVDNLPGIAILGFYVSTPGYGFAKIGLGTSQVDSFTVREIGMPTIMPGMNDVQIVLPPAVRIQGTVIDSSTNRPIAGQKLVARVKSDIGPRGERYYEVPKGSKSGDDGKFVFKNLPLGLQRLSLLGHASLLRNGRQTGSHYKPKPTKSRCPS
jgi:hypothetical protein